MTTTTSRCVGRRAALDVALVLTFRSCGAAVRRSGGRARIEVRA